jgi:hypothetical protein
MNSYIKSLIGVEPGQLDYGKIETFFQSARKEDNFIEFKSFRTGENIDKALVNIYDTVCAFLNSDGGLLIWGAPQKTTVDGLDEYKAPLAPVNQKFEKDWLISKVSGNIVPLPGGIQIHVFEKNGSYLYLFEVQKSNYSPHQTGSKYLMKLDGHTKPAPHHFVEALFRRVTYPRIEGYIKFASTSLFTQANRGLTVRLDISVLIVNQSRFQNEEQVWYELWTDNGTISDRSATPIPQFKPDGDHYRHKVDGIVHYGGPPLDDYYLYFDFAQLSNNGWKSKLLVTFGGKNSPMKVTQYHLDLAFVQQLPHNTRTDANKAVTSKNENQSLSEWDDENKITEAEKVDQILGRNQKPKAKK